MSNFFSKLFESNDIKCSDIIKHIANDREAMTALGKIFYLWHDSARKAQSDHQYKYLDEKGQINGKPLSEHIKTLLHETFNITLTNTVRDGIENKVHSVIKLLDNDNNLYNGLGFEDSNVQKALIDIFMPVESLV